MPSELALAVAAAIAAKSGEALVAEGRSALAALARTVRDRFRRDRSGADALDQAVAHPDDPDRQFTLAEHLGRALDDDPRFAGDVLAQWRGVQTELTLGEGAVSNTFSGSAQKVVQARDIHGDLTF